MKMKSLLITLALMLAGTVTLAQAAPVSVTYTTSGSSGHWVYDFSLTNNTGNQYLYFFGADIADGTITGVPSGFVNRGAGWSDNGEYYPQTFITSGPYENTVKPSTTESGFEMTSTAEDLQSTVNTFIYGYNYGVAYQGTDYQMGYATNPGFRVTATPAESNNVPEPASLALLAAGLLGAGFARKRNSAK